MSKNEVIFKLKRSKNRMLQNQLQNQLFILQNPSERVHSENINMIQMLTRRKLSSSHYENYRRQKIMKHHIQMFLREYTQINMIQSNFFGIQTKFGLYLQFSDNSDWCLLRKCIWYVMGTNKYINKHIYK